MERTTDLERAERDPLIGARTALDRRGVADAPRDGSLLWVVGGACRARQRVRRQPRSTPTARRSAAPATRWRRTTTRGRAGTHSDVSCIECHVDRGLPARFAHKFVALGEVRSHFTGDTRFPRPDPPDVPPDRCTRCHPSMPETTDVRLPSRRSTSRKGTCAGCHPDDRARRDARRAPSSRASTSQRSPPTIPAGAIAAVGAGSANVAGHRRCRCSDCHDLAKTGCKRCHTSQHKPRGDCLLCHRAGRDVEVRPPEQRRRLRVVPRAAERPHRRWRLPALPRQARRRRGCTRTSPDRTAPPATSRPPSTGRAPALDCHKQAGQRTGRSPTRARARTAAPATRRPRDTTPATACAATTAWACRSPSATRPPASTPGAASPCKKCHPSGTATVSCTCHGGRPPRD